MGINFYYGKSVISSGFYTALGAGGFNIYGGGVKGSVL